jgi:hypothetical protein
MQDSHQISPHIKALMDAALAEIANRMAERIDKWIGECCKEVLPVEVVRCFVELPKSPLSPELMAQVDLKVVEVTDAANRISGNREFVFAQKQESGAGMPYRPCRLLRIGLDRKLGTETSLNYDLVVSEAQIAPFIEIPLANPCIRAYLRRRSREATFVGEAYARSFGAPDAGAPNGQQQPPEQSGVGGEREQPAGERGRRESEGNLPVPPSDLAACDGNAKGEEPADVPLDQGK